MASQPCEALGHTQEMTAPLRGTLKYGPRPMLLQELGGSTHNQSEHRLPPVIMTPHMHTHIQQNLIRKKIEL